MHKGMLPVPGVLRRCAAVLATAAVVAMPLLPATAKAQEPAGSTVVGELVQAWPEAPHDDAAGQAAAAQPLTWIETPDGDSVRIPTEDAAGLEPGATVEVTVGGEVPDAAAGDGLAPARELIDGEVVADAEQVRAVTNEVTVALVAPNGVEHDTVTAQQVADAVDGPVADFWSEQTGGAVELHVAETHDWVDTTVGCRKPGKLWKQAAAMVGFEPGPGKHLLLYLSSASASNCAYGLAKVGSRPGSGGFAYVRDVLPSLIAHELGHNFGLGHSSALHCADGPETGGCTTAPYRDHYDVMGASWDQVGTLNVIQAATLGLLGRSHLRTLLADGSTAEVTLAPLAGTSGVRAVRLIGSAGRQYWLELRTATGQDDWLGTAADGFGLETGVLVRRLGDWPDTSLLLDPTPTAGRAGDFRTAVPVGETVRLAGGFAVTVTQSDAGGATLAVASSASGDAAGTVIDPSSGDAPEVLAGEAAATTVPEPPGAEPAPATPASDETVDTTPASAADEVEQETLAAAPAVVPASQSRSLALPVAAAAALAGAALLVGVQLVRTRVRR